MSYSDDDVRRWHAWYMEEEERTYEDVAFEFRVSVGTVGGRFRKASLPRKVAQGAGSVQPKNMTDGIRGKPGGGTVRLGRWTQGRRRRRRYS